MADGDLQVGREVAATRPAEPSASTLLLRDGPDGLEVCMLERHVETDFAGGALIFPGGKLDPRDADLPDGTWEGLDPVSRVQDLGVDTSDEALALHVCAVRETFEEAGVLLARTGQGAPVDVDLLAEPYTREVREGLAARGADLDWRPWLVERGLVLDLGALVPFAWWVTPDGLHRRYSTRFFAAAVPPEQATALRHDDVETTSSRWVRPSDALAAGARGEVTVIYPTRKLLELLARYPTAADVLAAARERRVDLRPIQPRLVQHEGRTMVQHPDGGDPEPG
ncbi:MAG: NUDIX hydrolase [Actinomycetes bacterium]